MSASRSVISRVLLLKRCVSKRRRFVADSQSERAAGVPKRATHASVQHGQLSATCILYTTERICTRRGAVGSTGASLSRSVDCTVSRSTPLLELPRSGCRSPDAAASPSRIARSFPPNPSRADG
eukprot:scaffold155162_cov26-Tisochrysis_lutea.AAC.3